MATGGDLTDVRVVTDEALQCLTCRREPYLQLRFPDASAAPDGYLRVALCPCACEIGSAGRELLDWFATHQQVTEANVDGFSVLLRGWLDDVVPPAALVSDAVLAAVLPAWAAR